VSQVSVGRGNIYPSHNLPLDAESLVGGPSCLLSPLVQCRDYNTCPCAWHFITRVLGMECKLSHLKGISFTDTATRLPAPHQLFLTSSYLCFSGWLTHYPPTSCRLRIVRILSKNESWRCEETCYLMGAVSKDNSVAKERLLIVGAMWCIWLHIEYKGPHFPFLVWNSLLLPPHPVFLFLLAQSSSFPYLCLPSASTPVLLLLPSPQFSYFPHPCLPPAPISVLLLPNPSAPPPASTPVSLFLPLPLLLPIRVLLLLSLHLLNFPISLTI
jgi:hypothetical protein